MFLVLKILDCVFLTCSLFYLSLIILLEGVFATLPFTERGMPIVINGDPKGNNFLYCNGNAVVIRDINVSWLGPAEN